MNYVLNGSIARAHPYQLDKTLSVEGAGAEAKATGEAIEEAKKQTKTHAENTVNPHNVTKEQVGLGKVDNTSDEEKPVSTAQATAIADAKKAGTDAQTTADEAKTAAETAQTTADEAKSDAETAQTTADAAKTSADTAQKTADSKTAWFTASVKLYLVDWKDNKMEVDVPGVTENTEQPIFVTPDPDSAEGYNFFGIKPTAQAADKITFSCDSVPDCDITVNVVGFTVPVEPTEDEDETEGTEDTGSTEGEA